MCIGRVDYLAPSSRGQFRGKTLASVFGSFQESCDRDVLIQAARDMIDFSLPIIIEKNQIDRIVGTNGSVLKEAV